MLLWAVAFLTGLLAAAGNVAAAPGDPPAYSDVFEKAFVAGFSVTTPSVYEADRDVTRKVPFRVITIGKLKITSGQICAADPFVQLEATKPFKQPVPSGEFPVRLAVADHPAGKVTDTRVAFARVDFSNRPVVTWRQALIEGQDLATLKPDENFGYPVDAGTGSFYDPAAIPPVDAMYKANPDVWQIWQNEGEATGSKIVGPHSFVLMLPTGDVNVAMFNSGWGDGFYTSWFGYDADGKVAALLTDFDIIAWDKSKW